jgi:hypothetical protein
LPTTSTDRCRKKTDGQWKERSPIAKSNACWAASTSEKDGQLGVANVIRSPRGRARPRAQMQCRGTRDSDDTRRLWKVNSLSGLSSYGMDMSPLSVMPICPPWWALNSSRYTFTACACARIKEWPTLNEMNSATAQTKSRVRTHIHGSVLLSPTADIDRSEQRPGANTPRP